MSGICTYRSSGHSQSSMMATNGNKLKESKKPKHSLMGGLLSTVLANRTMEYIAQNILEKIH